MTQRPKLVPRRHWRVRLTNGEVHARSKLRMNTGLYYVATFATLAVLGVLVAGLYTMMRGTSANLSQKLMRWRVGLQFLALVLLMGYILLSR